MSGRLNGFPPSGPIRRYLWSFVEGRWQAKAMLASVVILTVLILTAPTRTIQLQARTLSAEIEIQSNLRAWNLDGALICAPSLDVSVEDARCGAMSNAIDTPERGYEWARGQRLQVDWTAEGLQITVLTDGNAWQAGTVLYVPKADVARNGALAFGGLLTLGQEIGPGSTRYVLDGSYAFFEKGLLARLVPRWSPDETRSGRIKRGDALEIVCENNWYANCTGTEIPGKPGLHANFVSGSITVDGTGAGYGMHVVALGAEENSLLSIAYAGRDAPLLVRPNWVQRAAASSGLLALSLLFSIIAPLLLTIFDRPKP